MTKYEHFTNQIENCKRKADEATNGDLKVFFIHAAEGFETKRDKMTLEQAGEQI